MSGLQKDPTSVRRIKRIADWTAISWFLLWALAYPFFVLAPDDLVRGSTVISLLGLTVRMLGLGFALAALALDMRAERHGYKATLRNRAPFVLLVVFSLHYIDELFWRITGINL